MIAYSFNLFNDGQSPKSADRLRILSVTRFKRYYSALATENE